MDRKAKNAELRKEHRAARLLEQIGLEPSDEQNIALLNIAKKKIDEGEKDEDILEVISAFLDEDRYLSSKSAVDQAKRLRKTIQRMVERRPKIKRLEEKWHDMKKKDHPDDFETDAEEYDHERATREVQERIKLEKETQKRDEEFARNLMRGISTDLKAL